MPDHEQQYGHAVTVFWRPGCGFCSGLLAGLERTGLRFDRVNIWDDPEAAALVRSVAGGNETVPTVRIGDVALINPTPRDVMRELASKAPDQLPTGYEPPPPTRTQRLADWLRRA